MRLCRLCPPNPQRVRLKYSGQALTRDLAVWMSFRICVRVYHVWVCMSRILPAALDEVDLLKLAWLQLLCHLSNATVNTINSATRLSTVQRHNRHYLIRNATVNSTTRLSTPQRLCQLHNATFNSVTPLSTPQGVYQLHNASVNTSTPLSKL